MKRMLATVVTLVLLATMFAIPAQATTENPEPPEGAVFLDNGMYYVDEITIESGGITTFGTIRTVKGSKTRTSYSPSGAVNFKLTVHGTFTVNTGVSATCTASTYSYSIVNSDWRLTAGSARKSANTAIAEGTFKRKVLFIDVETVATSIMLSCNTNGTLS